MSLIMGVVGSIRGVKGLSIWVPSGVTYTRIMGAEE
jgi:hypothetical protein